MAIREEKHCTENKNDMTDTERRNSRQKTKVLHDTQRKKEWHRKLERQIQKERNPSRGKMNGGTDVEKMLDSRQQKQDKV